MTPPTQIKITMDAASRGKVFVDGVDWSDKLKGIDISAHLGKQTEVILHLSNVTVETEVAVEISTPGRMRPGA